MASSNKSKLSKLDRDNFLIDNGFVALPNRGKGDHTVWEHPALKALAKKQKIECPSHLLNNVAQPAWQHTVPDNPGGQLWHRIAKHAKWCQDTVGEAKGAVEAEARRRQKKLEIQQNRQEICDWKREARHRFKAGLDARPAPTAYQLLAARP